MRLLARARLGVAELRREGADDRARLEGHGEVAVDASYLFAESRLTRLDERRVVGEAMRGSSAC